MSNNISNSLRDFQQKIKTYATAQYPGMAGKKALRFIDDNFRNQSWAGLPQVAWHQRKAKDRGRALLVRRGILRRSFRMEAIGPAVRIYTDVAYAKAHNEGFNGPVFIPAHKRRLYGRFQVSSIKTRKTATKKLERGETVVRAHTRTMRLPRRQFMPTESRPSSVLNAQIKRAVLLEVIKIRNACKIQ